MHEIFFLLAALVGIGLLGYLITIITPQLFSSIGLLMLAAGLAEGIPTGFWYHVVLRRILIERGNLPAKWWIHPTCHHAQLSPDEHRRIRLWFVLGGIGYAIALAGGLAAIVGLLIQRLLVPPVIAGVLRTRGNRVLDYPRLRGPTPKRAMSSDGLAAPALTGEGAPRAPPRP